MDRYALRAFLLILAILFSIPAQAQVESNFSADGGIRIGNSTTPCAAGIAGAIRYSSSGGNSVMQWCNGSSWANIGNNAALALGNLTDAYTDYPADHNIFIGSGAGAAHATGSLRNIVVGEEAATSLTTSDDNVAIGYRAMYYHTTGTGQNVAVGSGALLYDSTGEGNVGVGYRAAFNTSTGWGNTATGVQALYSNQTGNTNSAFGGYALGDTTASENSAFGYIALWKTTTGYENDAFGAGSLGTNTTGHNNAAFGYYALNKNTTASYNTALGGQAMANSTTSANNIAVGFNALNADTTSGNNTALGYKAGDSLTTGTGNIMIGYDVDAVAASSSSTLNIGDTIYGNLANDYVGIGVAAPPSRFIVAPPAAQTIAAGNTITADACGTVKLITAAGGVTTNTTDTFTAPTASYAGCCMDVVNTGSNQITLDSNAKFKTAGAGNVDVVMPAVSSVRVCSNGTSWYQISAVLDIN